MHLYFFFSVGECANQCDQMMKLKVAQFFNKVAQVVATVDFYFKCAVFQSSPKTHQMFWLLLKDKFGKTTIQKW